MLRRILIGTMIFGLVAVIVWRLRAARDPDPAVGSNAPAPKSHAVERVKVDLAKYRADRDERLRRAKELATKSARDRPPAPAGSPPRPLTDFGKGLTEPSCVLGPGEFCLVLADEIAACDGGDARACLAVGQHVSETTPRPLIGIGFFIQACRLGDQAGCARADALKAETPVLPCEQDVFACAWRGYRKGDVGRLEEACGLGVADACAYLSDKTEGEHARAYLEQACQLGNPMTCLELSRRLLASCSPQDKAPCYPPDPAQAKEAAAIACAAGWTTGCD